jgi:hypothetical protein
MACSTSRSTRESSLEQQKEGERKIVSKTKEDTAFLKYPYLLLVYISSTFLI